MTPRLNTADNINKVASVMSPNAASCNRLLAVAGVAVNLLGVMRSAKTSRVNDLAMEVRSISSALETAREEGKDLARRLLEVMEEARTLAEQAAEPTQPAAPSDYRTLEDHDVIRHGDTYDGPCGGGRCGGSIGMTVAEARRSYPDVVSTVERMVQ